MATLHVSETEAVRDIENLLAKVRSGSEVVVEGEDQTIAVISPPRYTMENPEPGYDEWFRARVQEALDADPATDLSEEEAEAYFAAKRQAVLARMGQSK